MERARKGETTEGTVWLVMGPRRQGTLRVLSEEVLGVGGGHDSLARGEG